MIKEEKGKWVIYSEDGSKKLGTYDSEAEAKKRLKQIEWFKSHPKEGNPDEITTEECDYGMGVNVAPMIPMDVHSFAALRDYNKTQEVAEDLRKMDSQFTSMIGNILMSGTPDKVASLRALVEEFAFILQGFTPEQPVQPGTPQVDLGLDANPEMDEGHESAVEDGPQPEKVVESYEGTATVIAEGAPEPSSLALDVVIIKPGWGNHRDNHFYSREMLESPGIAEKFIGAKMYETNHDPKDKNTRSWVSTITGVQGHTPEGAPIMRVAVHDPNFAQRIINLNSEGLLHKMECSILADALAERQVYEEGGRKGKRISGITSVESVDWVTRAGAGGHALKLAESADPVEEPALPLHEEGESTMLTKEQIVELLGKTQLPKASQVRLAEGSYEDEAAVTAVVSKEVEYIKVLTASGKPFSVGESEEPTVERMSEAEFAEVLDEIDQAFGLKE